jgi:hypothetical protein
MQTNTIAELIPVLQTAIGPVILISGIGLLLLTMTNRLGRTIDRTRELSALLLTATGDSQKLLQEQLRIFWRRARLIRTAIALASLSALAAAILVILLFFTALLQWSSGWLIIILFSICLLCLIGSLILFIRDINQSLTALKLELRLDGFEKV